MERLQLRDNLYRKMTFATILFVVLCNALFIIYYKNMSFFETHGKIGNLAEIEQQAVAMENSRKFYSKQHIAVEVKDEPAGELRIPFLQEITNSQISVKEEFLQNKLIITIKDTEQLIATKAKVLSDSRYMNGISLYNQREDTVIELFCNDIYAYDYSCENGEFVMHFDDLQKVYDKTAIVYIPYEQRDNFASEEWQNEIKALAEQNGCRIFICPQMQEEYTQKDIVDFANQMRVDYLLAIDVNTKAESTQLDVICNPQYFIPEFHSVDLGVIMGEDIKTNTGVPIASVSGSSDDNPIVLQAMMPSAKVNVQIKNETLQTIEEEYSFFHGIMEGIKLSLTDVFAIQNQDEDI